MYKGKQLQIGDKAVTDWNGPGTITHVEIRNRVDGYSSQSRIAFQVSPRLKNCSGNAWIDADWFKPAPNVQIEALPAYGQSLSNAGLED